MNGETYLSYEEQFKESISLPEIDRIQNIALREIRDKYWLLRHKAFLNEAEIKDWELEKVLDKLREQEQAEIKRFR